MSALLAPQLVNSFEQVMNTTIDSGNMAPLVASQPYEIAKIIVAIFVNNKGFAESKTLCFLNTVR